MRQAISAKGQFCSANFDESSETKCGERYDILNSVSKPDR
jgi:hypothetical protein